MADEELGQDCLQDTLQKKNADRQASEGIVVKS
jgi:hypothetical protein